MILRCRITAFHAGTLGVALLFVTAWSWFEFCEQRDVLLAGGAAAAPRVSPAREALEILLVGGLPALFISVVGGHFLMRRAFQPITDLTEQLEQTDVTNLATPVRRSGNGDELDRMAVVFNRLKQRLGASFTQAREFTLHASHELKTPLTILHGTLEQMLQDTAATPAQQQERIGSMLEEVQRLSGIVSQLTFLAKADAGQLSKATAEVRLSEMVRELADDLVLLSQAARLTVRLEAVEDVSVVGDRMRLRQLLLILGDNAVKHNEPGGSITLGLQCIDHQACFHMTNTGPTLAPELRARVFERFFRGDASHSNAVEGSGLGLSIAQSIATSHDGTLTYSVLHDNRTCLELRLPVSPSMTGI